MVNKIGMCAIAFILVFSSSQAQISTGTAVLPMNYEISFGSGAMNKIGFKNMVPYPAAYPCSVSVDSSDFYFISRDCGTCMYYCPCEIIGSVRPFYISEKSTNQLGNQSFLDSADTSVFKKVAVGSNCFDKTSGSTCLLPSVSPGKFNTYCRSYGWSKPIIVRTKKNKYVLMTLTPRYSLSCDESGPPPYQCNSYVSTIEIHWFRQNSGAFNFNGVFVSTQYSGGNQSEHSIPSRAYTKITQGPQRGFYDILGRKQMDQSANKLWQQKIKSGIFTDGRSVHLLFVFP